MIRWTEMNSPALIWPAYISDFCGRINKFTSKSIMHDFIFIISTGERLLGSLLFIMYAERLAACWNQMSTVSVLCQIITVYSAKHSIRRCIAVKIYNETEPAEWNHRLPFIPLSRHAEAFNKSKTFVIVSNFERYCRLSHLNHQV